MKRVLIVERERLFKPLALKPGQSICSVETREDGSTWMNFLMPEINQDAIQGYIEVQDDVFDAIVSE